MKKQTVSKSREFGKTTKRRSWVYHSNFKSFFFVDRLDIMSVYSIGLLSITEIFGDFALKKYANEGGLGFLGYGLLGYAGVIYFLVQSLKGSSVLMVNAAWVRVYRVIVGVSHTRRTVQRSESVYRDRSNCYRPFFLENPFTLIFFLR